MLLNSVKNTQICYKFISNNTLQISFWFFLECQKYTDKSYHVNYMLFTKLSKTGKLDTNSVKNTQVIAIYI